MPSRLLLFAESLVLSLFESVLLAALEHLKMASLLGERALGQSDETSGMLLFGCELVLTLRIVAGVLRTFFSCSCFSIAAFLGLMTLLPV